MALPLKSREFPRWKGQTWKFDGLLPKNGRADDVTACCERGCGIRVTVHPAPVAR